jgi:2,4-dienoyl-CoA reductase-like NADH-dependent reductase (Old Yellow Enzyme family)
VVVDGKDKEQSTLLYWAEKNLKDGNVDLVGIGRQAIADPEFAGKVVEGRVAEIKWCTTCGECTMLLGGNKRVGCTVYDKEYKALLKKG